MRHPLLTTIGTATAAMLMVGCHRIPAYDHYEHASIAGWEKNDTLLFSVPPITESGTYSADLGLRITPSYPFMGLTLIVERTVIPASHRPPTIHTDTINCRLMDETGKVKGHGISSFQYRYHLSDILLNAGDSLQVAVRHDMKREILPGVSDVGYILRRE